ncbi:hypothetical protein ACFC1R_04330 [Kitasatospora sp. NPDC056138]
MKHVAVVHGNQAKLDSFPAGERPEVILLSVGTLSLAGWLLGPR